MMKKLLSVVLVVFILTISCEKPMEWYQYQTINRVWQVQKADIKEAVEVLNLSKCKISPKRADDKGSGCLGDIVLRQNPSATYKFGYKIMEGNRLEINALHPISATLNEGTFVIPKTTEWTNLRTDLEGVWHYTTSEENLILVRELDKATLQLTEKK